MNDDLLNAGMGALGATTAAQGMMNANQLAVSAQEARRIQSSQLQAAMNTYQPFPNTVTAGTPFRKSPRVSIEVGKVTNGFTLKSSSGDLLIAKDLEELQGLFVAQVAAMLLEDK